MATTPAPSAVVELLKPLTWFAPMWAFACGVISSGQPAHGQWPVIAAGVVLAGPLVCATSQATNDWFDRHVDAINEPGRPIPSGRIPGRWGLYLALGWTLLSLLVAAALGPWILGAALFGLVLAWIYSAPPLRLKKNGWWGNAAVGLCYEGLPWFTGAAVMAAALPDRRVLLVALLYSIGAHGIMTLNDFKSVEGDRRMGLLSLPVQMGTDRAARFACLVMAVPQVVVIGLLLAWERQGHAALVAALLAGQLALMVRFLKSPRERAAWYNGTGTTLYVLGMLVAAFALRPLVGGA
ncbi:MULTISPECIES: chlorophyll synthase ChlG [unclassified Methylobacterium]|uniref:chlorophyll synthase ChlG n=1 Tax=unclassified Methylobacterium TaxID=2615210 RepID=UPI001FB974CD|nr:MULTISPECIES: chlorophyll synthase ChlG [unclassified Methylobacterium]MCJ2094336.1 chlorophyll synthase ChlG [Methylobacterium sp. J-072]MCJ2140147.1 chlorophyll synthase ChlG [Methylobacterium sp. E-066]